MAWIRTPFLYLYFSLNLLPFKNSGKGVKAKAKAKAKAIANGTQFLCLDVLSLGMTYFFLPIPQFV
jgi:hypothetical protein